MWLAKSSRVREFERERERHCSRFGPWEGTEGRRLGGEGVRSVGAEVWQGSVGSDWVQILRYGKVRGLGLTVCG